MFVRAIDRKGAVMAKDMAKAEAQAQQTWAPNEAPAKRWLIFFVAAYLVGELIRGVFGNLTGMLNLTGSWAWLPEVLDSFGGFALSFLVQAYLLKLICKTTLHELIFGRTGKFDLRVAALVIGCWILGAVIASFVLTPYEDSGTQLNTIGIVPIVVNIVLALALVWMQTTWEEVMFRGVVLRGTCGDHLRPTVKSIAGGVLVSLFFMSMHLLNPEVRSQTSALMLVAMASTYFISAFLWYMLDIVFGSCLPGCAIHFINNLAAMVLVSSSNSVIQSATILVNAGSMSGTGALIEELILCIPLLIVCIVMFVRRSKAGWDKELA